VKGLDSTLGYVGRAFSKASSDALLVKVLRQLGAVIVAKTNLPQSIMVCGMSKNATSSIVLIAKASSGVRLRILSGG
jgi:Asp-tRNA(Asn)/Glu-tRNA(Gln) amidotransferase A subunit family amidase